MEQRTQQQNKALHLWCELLAEELNNSGNNVQAVIKHTMDVDWNKELIKELLVKRALKTQFGKDSTTEMTTQEIDKVFDTVNRFVGEKFGVHVDFPSIETINFLMNENRN